MSRSGKKRTVGDTLLKEALGASPAKAPYGVSVNQTRLLRCKNIHEMKTMLRDAHVDLGCLNAWVDSLTFTTDEDTQTSMHDFCRKNLPSGKSNDRSEMGSGSADPLPCRKPRVAYQAAREKILNLSPSKPKPTPTMSVGVSMDADGFLVHVEAPST